MDLRRENPGALARHRPDEDRCLPRHADRPSPGSRTRPRVRRLRERGVSSAGFENLS